jgi:hypothetical protein
MGKHEKLLKKILQKPRPANIRWTEIENMLIHYGAKIREGKGSGISVILNDKIAVFHRPHPDNKADKGAIETAIKFLKITGIIREE